MKNISSILTEAGEFVTDHLRNELSADLIFHNYSHTKEVVFSAQEMCSRNQSPALKKEVVLLATWFHDCGYSKTYNGHEEASCDIAKAFFAGKKLASNLIKDVMECIMSTKYPQHPQTVEAQLLCDADFFHFARTDYDKHEQRLRREWELCLGKFYSDSEWHQQNCDLLLNHRYFTAYGQNVLQKFKDVNIEMMRCLI